MPSSTIQLCLDGKLELRLTYQQWEEQFVAHWGCIPISGSEAMSEWGEPGHAVVVDIMLRRRGKTRGSLMDFHEAARFFHTGPVRFRSYDQFHRFEQDFSKVEPELAEDELDDEDFIRLEDQDLRLGVTEDLNRVTFDMGRGAQFPDAEDRALPRRPSDVLPKGERRPDAGEVLDVEVQEGEERI